MGISGHMLGPRKLRRLERETGIPFERAYNRNGKGAARVLAEDGTCLGHWVIDFRSMEVSQDPHPWHWFSCKEANE